jgi:hypothetical protein
VTRNDAHVARVENTDLPRYAFWLNGYLRPIFPDRRPPEYAQWSRAEQLAWDDKFRKSPEGVALMPVRRYYLLELTGNGGIAVETLRAAVRALGWN